MIKALKVNFRLVVFAEKFSSEKLLYQLEQINYETNEAETKQLYLQAEIR